MYSSANRDEEHFDDPERFDVTATRTTTSPSGSAPTSASAPSLARLEIQAMFQELLAKVDRFERPVDGAVVDIPNSFVYGVKHADITIVPN